MFARGGCGDSVPLLVGAQRQDAQAFADVRLASLRP
jgi:hypothetical protein